MSRRFSNFAVASRAFHSLRRDFHSPRRPYRILFTKAHVSPKRKTLESSLYRWTRELPRNLRLSYKLNGSEIYTVSAYNFNARQLHIPYFITLVILGRSTASQGYASSVALLASSFIASIFEVFLARDEIQFLGPIFTFYLLAAGVALGSIRRYSALWTVAQQDLAVLQKSLQELSKRWPSAIGAMKALHNSIEATGVSEDKEIALPALEWLDPERRTSFSRDSPQKSASYGDRLNNKSMAPNQWTTSQWT